MIEFLFLDLDDTILDFHKAERIALAKTIRDFGVEPTEHVLHRYHIINKLHWEMLERGELTRAEVQVGRFRALFEELGVAVDAAAVTAKDFSTTIDLAPAQPLARVPKKFPGFGYVCDPKVGGPIT